MFRSLLISSPVISDVKTITTSGLFWLFPHFCIKVFAEFQLVGDSSFYFPPHQAVILLQDNQALFHQSFQQHMGSMGYLIVREHHSTMFLSLTSLCFVISKSFLKSSLPFSISDSYFFNNCRTSSLSLSSAISSSRSKVSVSSMSRSTAIAGSIRPLLTRLLTICFAIKGTPLFGMRILFFHKRQKCNIPCSLDCSGQFPLMG